MVDRIGPRAALPLEPLLRARSYRSEELLMAAEALSMIESAEAAALMASVAGEDKVRDIVTEYFTRTPRLARRALTTAAAASPGVAKVAQLILKSLPDGGRARAMSGEAAEGAGAPQAAAAEAIASDMPSILLSPPWGRESFDPKGSAKGAAKKVAAKKSDAASRPPALPRFYNATILPRLRLKESGALLPVSAMEDIGRLLVVAPRDGASPHLQQVRAAVDPAGLADFAWEVFLAWSNAGSAPKENWALAAVGHLGNDGSAMRLAPLIEDWAGGGTHGRADVALEALVRIGSTIALRELWRLGEENDRYPAFQRNARSKLSRVAEERGMTAEQLADWLVPDMIVQPFPQLGREVHHLTAAERKATALRRFKGRKVSYGDVLGLTRFGWRIGPKQGHAMVFTYTRELPRAPVGACERVDACVRMSDKATLSLEPGLFVAEMAESGEQTLGDVIVEREGSGRPISLGSVQLIAMSELVRELTAAFDEKD